MTEATEFLVWTRALAEAPRRLAELLADAPRAVGGVIESMTRHDLIAMNRLAAMLEVAPASVSSGEGLDAFAAGRSQLVALLERVDGSCLHRTIQLESGKVLDPWRLAGELAELDVRHLAEIRRMVSARRSPGC